MAKRRNGRGEQGELISVLLIVLLFFAVLMGRELGDIYSSFGEISQLSVLFQVGEEELASYVRDVLRGEASDLEVGLALTLPSVRNVEGVVTQMPDYVRKWMISIYLSPIVVRQPEVSDVEVRLLVEGEVIHTQRFSFEREKVPYITLLDRMMVLHIEDVDRFREAVRVAAERYSGEVELTFTGQALAHFLFLKDWLPFSTTRYPLVKVPHVEYISSKWTDTEGNHITTREVESGAFIQFQISNPTRVHSIRENVTVTIYRGGLEEPVHTSWKEAAVAPGTTATYVFPFTPEEPGDYFYSLEASDAFSLDADASPHLKAEDS
jgi:hypothetical protein